MAKAQSLDELIGKKAAEFADQVLHTASIADKEEEIRIEIETQLAFIRKETTIEFEKGKHEFTVAKGRIDSLYSRVLIEYKNPSDPASRIGPRLDSPGSKKLVDQIKSRFKRLKDEHGHPFNTLFGAGPDGDYLVLRAAETINGMQAHTNVFITLLAVEEGAKAEFRPYVVMTATIR